MSQSDHKTIQIVSAAGNFNKHNNKGKSDTQNVKGATNSIEPFKLDVKIHEVQQTHNNQN